MDEDKCQKCGYAPDGTEGTERCLLLKKHDCHDYDHFKNLGFVPCSKCKYVSVWFEKHLEHVAQCNGARMTYDEPKHFKESNGNGENNNTQCQKCDYSESSDELLKKHNCDDYNFFKLYRFVLCDKCKYFSVWYKEHLDHLEKCDGGGSSSDSLLNQK